MPVAGVRHRSARHSSRLTLMPKLKDKAGAMPALGPNSSITRQRAESGLIGFHRALAMKTAELATIDATLAATKQTMR